MFRCTRQGDCVLGMFRASAQGVYGSCIPPPFGLAGRMTRDQLVSKDFLKVGWVERFQPRTLGGQGQALDY
jgi:hypothetical protein